MGSKYQNLRGRGASSNPANRFEAEEHVADEYCEEPLPRPETRYIPDHSASVISRNKSPDVGFEVSLNPYRGCEHGCAYCYARPTHEYLGFSGGLDFETRILYKADAAALLRKALSEKSWKPQTLVMSGVTDPYQPLERKMRITRSCLEVLAECRHPVGLISKNHLITRDVDILSEMAAQNLCHATLSITSLNPKLTAVLEPRSSRPASRLKAVRELSDAGVPVNVNFAPVIPGLNDHEMLPVLEAAKENGAVSAGFIVMRLPLVVAPIFEEWLEEFRPEAKDKILNRIKDLRRGKLNSAEFGDRMRGQGPWAEMYRTAFHAACKKLGLNRPGPGLRTDLFRRPSGDQLQLF